MVELLLTIISIYLLHGRSLSLSKTNLKTWDKCGTSPFNCNMVKKTALQPLYRMILKIPIQKQLIPLCGCYRFTLNELKIYKITDNWKVSIKNVYSILIKNDGKDSAEGIH